MSGEQVRVLDADRALADAVPAAEREAARLASAASVIAVRRGSWPAAGSASNGFGLLVLEGLLVRRVGFEGRWGAELLGPADLSRPWEGEGEGGGTLPFETAWRVMAPARMAVLDLDWVARMAPYPGVAAALVGRAVTRSRRLATTMAIVQLPRLEERLWLLLWELADRYGRVHRDGVHLDVPLTHEQLAHLAAARRPSVTGALSRLAEQGRVRRDGRAWVLAGEPPRVSAASRS